MLQADCVFCGIIRDPSSAFVVLDDSMTLALLDRRPIFPGHCLLIPKMHYETIEDLPSDIIGPLFSNAKRLSIAVRLAMKADGTFLGINNKVSQSVPHLHLHIVPRRAKDGLRGFFWPRQKYESEEEQVKIRDAIRRELEALVT